MQRRTARNHRPIWAYVAALAAVWLAVPAAQAQPAAPVSVPPAERLAAVDTTLLQPAARRAIAASLARWQALPPLPVGRWLLVNIPAYEIHLFDGPARVGTWRAIVGKLKTPTPTFVGEAKGVILNPWWDVPASIVAESVGRLVARQPKLAASRGYVRDGDRYRQRPGPENQLGQMKLDFINAHSIGIHDTPSKALFDRDKRALSHGCIRVYDPFGFAAALLGPPESADSLKTVVATTSDTRRIAFVQPIPVIVGYFTAEVADDGSLRIFDDVYRREPAKMALISTETDCAIG
jgi:murein L,D-transpeptidase YcbB/YkuD